MTNCKYLVVLLAALLLAGCSQLTVKQQMATLEQQAIDEVYQFEALPTGMQGDPELDGRVINLPAGKSFYKGYQLPLGHSRMIVQLRTYIHKTEVGEGFFYPVVDIFDFNGKLIESKKTSVTVYTIKFNGSVCGRAIGVGARGFKVCD